MALDTCKVLIVDDHPLVLRGLADILVADPLFTVVGTGSGFQDALSSLESISPDIALIDIHLGDGNGFDLTQAIKSRWPQIKVVLISAQDEHTCAGWSLQSGADGMINKAAEPQEFRDILRKVWLGGLGFREEVHYWLLRSMRKELSGGIHRLSPREFSVLLLIGCGKNSNEIAYEMEVSPRTIETYHRNIRQKLGIPHHDALIRLATMLFASGEAPAQIDEETTLLRDFEARVIPLERWTHYQQLLVAFQYLSRYPFEAALEKLRTGVQRLAIAHGKPEAYHETITVASAHHLHSLLATSHIWVHGKAFLTAHPELLSNDPTEPLLRYYTPESLESPEARVGFIEPDIAPLPIYSAD